MGVSQRSKSELVSAFCIIWAIQCMVQLVNLVHSLLLWDLVMEVVSYDLDKEALSQI